MFKKIVFLFAVLTFVGCSKIKESKNEISVNNLEAQEKMATPIPLGSEKHNPHAGASKVNQNRQTHPSTGQRPRVKRTVSVPETVKGKWQAVKLLIKEKKAGGYSQIKQIKLNSNFDLPDSQIHVQVKEFLPHMIINDDNFTSVSNDLNNPAVHLVITEGNKQLFDGWAYSNFPDMYNFRHDRYSVTLVDFVPAK